MFNDDDQDQCVRPTFPNRPSEENYNLQLISGIEVCSKFYIYSLNDRLS